MGPLVVRRGVVRVLRSIAVLLAISACGAAAFHSTTPHGGAAAST
jgi:hypothetical protein